MDTASGVSKGGAIMLTVLGRQACRTLCVWAIGVRALDHHEQDAATLPRVAARNTPGGLNAERFGALYLSIEEKRMFQCVSFPWPLWRSPSRCRPSRPVPPSDPNSVCLASAVVVRAAGHMVAVAVVDGSSAVGVLVSLEAEADSSSAMGRVPMVVVSLVDRATTVGIGIAAMGRLSGPAWRDLRPAP